MHEASYAVAGLRPAGSALHVLRQVCGRSTDATRKRARAATAPTRLEQLRAQLPEHAAAAPAELKLRRQLRESLTQLGPPRHALARLVLAREHLVLRAQQLP